MVQKATELGVSILRPVITRRTQAYRINLERMRANIIEAAEQCGILHIPEIAEPIKLESALQTWQEGRALVFCDEEISVSSPLETLRKIKPGPVAVLIGPEGGFDDDERQALSQQPSVHTISLGPRVMRADTAAVAALSLVNAVLGDWKPA